MRFAPPVNIKKENRQTNEKQAAAKHPHFIGQQRLNLLRREKRENNSQRGGNQPASAGQNQSRFAVEAFSRIRIDGDFQQRREHVQKRNELQHHGQRQQPLKRFLHPGSDRIHDDQNNRHHALNDQRHVRRRESRMRFPQPAGHVRIKPSHEWNARRTGEPGRPNPRDGNTQHQRKRSDDPIGADAAGHVADCLYNSLQHVDVVLAHRDQQRQRSRDVHYTGKNSAPGSVFCGSLISSPITDANSKPTNPKQITPNEFKTNRGFDGIRKSAAVTVVPNLAKTITPNPIKTAAAMPVPIPPRLLIHLPTPSPTIFRITSSAIRPTDATTVNILLSASAAWPGPSTKTETPTK